MLLPILQISGSDVPLSRSCRKSRTEQVLESRFLSLPDLKPQSSVLRDTRPLGEGRRLIAKLLDGCFDKDPHTESFG